MKKIIKSVCIVLLLCLFATGLVSCGGNVDDAVGVTYITLRINPEIELVADDDMKIIATNAINEDGEIVLSDLELVGMDADDAAEAFTEKATELGYIDVESEENTVYIDVVSDDEEDNEEIKEDLTDKINGYFENNGIFGKACAEKLETYAELVTLWGVSPGHAKMIVRILYLYPEMTEKDVLALTVPERIELLKEYSKNAGLTPDLNKDYAEEIEKIKSEYAQMFSISNRLELLKEALASTAITAEELAQIREEYAELKAEYDEMRKEYNEELDKIREAYKERAKEKREAAKKKAEERREKNAELISNHFENLKNQRKKQFNRLKKLREFFFIY